MILIASVRFLNLAYCMWFYVKDYNSFKNVVNFVRLIVKLCIDDFIVSF